MKLVPVRGRVAALALGLMAGLTNAATPAYAARPAAEHCFDFSHQEVGTAWPIDPRAALPLDAATLRVHPLVLDGVVQTPNVARLEVTDDAVAGGRRPELAGVAVAVQIEPVAATRSLRLRYAHQPGSGDGRAATVEINGMRRDWRGSFEQLNGAHLGGAGLPAHITVSPDGPTDGNGWQRGRMEVRLKQPGEIRSFTIGAAFLRLDDLCLGGAGPAD